jgi:hypothetical protein
MTVTINHSLRIVLAGALLLACTETLSVPKAAENAAGEVIIGAPTVHSKPAPKGATSPPAAQAKGGKSSPAGKATPRKKTSAKPKTKTNTKTNPKAKGKSRK